MWIGSLALPAGVATQVTQFAPGGSTLSREDLTGLLAQYELALESPAYSGRIKEEIRAAAERVRARLADGDLRPGDRVVLFIEGQAQLNDTVPVEPGPKISLPLFGEIPLKGVLRSEISSHLEKELGAMLRNPVVRAQALMRLSVQGAVGRPGFYVVPSDLLISEALMQAGGPAPTANLQAIRIERGPEVLYGGQELQTAMISGQTLDQLSLQAGDQILVPTAKASIWNAVGRYAMLIGSMMFLGIRIAG
jgi:hypothetical protein